MPDWKTISMSRHRAKQMQKSAAVRRNKPEPWYRKYQIWRDRSPEAKKAHQREQRKLTEDALAVANTLNVSPQKTLSFSKLDWQHRREVMSRYQWSRDE